MLGIVLVNFNTSALTLDCLHSLAADAGATPLRVVVVDNSDLDAECASLSAAVETGLGIPVERIASERNIGFAAACNVGIGRLLRDPGVERVLLVNNDAVVLEGGIAAMLDGAEQHPEADMIAARMHRKDDPSRVDSLGIAIYASALPSNRKRLAERLVGPTGGLALYSRRLLEALQRQGAIFDERFFCYAEDTDVALRALLLGFKPAYVDRVVALHVGQASSDGGFGDFVLYHGIRNSIWTIVKCLPASLLLLMSPLILTLHLGIVLRHSLGGSGRVVWRLYRDAVRGLPAMLKSRRAIQAQRHVSARDVARHITPSFYEHDYLRAALRELLPPWRRRHRN